MTSTELQQSDGSPTTAKIIYVLYLVSILFGFTSIVGLVMAYIYRSDAPEWLQQHYRYQIRTFWIGLLYTIVSSLMTMFLIGYVMLLAGLIWYIARCVKGLKALGEMRTVDNAGTWLV